MLIEPKYQTYQLAIEASAKTRTNFMLFVQSLTMECSIKKTHLNYLYSFLAVSLDRPATQPVNSLNDFLKHFI